MNINEVIAIVTGGASGLGESVVRKIAKNGGKAVILDLNEEQGVALSNELGDNVIFCRTDVSSESDVQNAVDAAVEKFGSINVAVSAAGILTAGKTVGKNGPFPLENFDKTIKINLTGTFNVIRLAAAKMAENNPDENGQRGVIISTASVAAFDGQMGQAAYSASKGGIVGMTLPIARDLSSLGIRNVTIAPGIFETPMMSAAPEKVRQSLIDQIPFPKRFGIPDEFASMVAHIIENTMLNGETIRLDGAVRMGLK